ncbi:MAG: hypothetical protein OSA47_01640 [Novosphingopyxis baekryungensis]|jgi:hypothetical protein|nr:hypothetical protein [Novosphingopyxis baekryungensis]
MTDQPRHPSQRYDRRPAVPEEAAPRHCAMLPHPVPRDPDSQLLLFAFRRMAQHGLRDAVAAERMLGRYGAQFRAPLVLLRAFVLELAQNGARNIAIGHCCMPRMTADESAILGVLADPDTGGECLDGLMGGASSGHAHQIAHFLAEKIAETKA